MSVLLSYAVVGVIPIFVALHLSYVRRRAAQEKTQTPRRGRGRGGAAEDAAPKKSTSAKTTAKAR